MALINMPVIFMDPFDQMNGNSIVTIWVNEFRKLDGNPVIVDWSAKAFKQYLPRRQHSLFSRIRSTGNTFQGNGSPWRINVYSPSMNNITLARAKEYGLAPIRKLRGIVKRGTTIPGWALDAHAPTVVRAFKTTQWSHAAANYFTIPDASDHQFTEILKGLQGALIDRALKGLKAINNFVLVINPELAFKKDLVLGLTSTVMDRGERFHCVTIPENPYSF